MNRFLVILCSLSVSGTLLLLFILGLKQLYKNKFSKRWQYYIWIIVALRFLLPFTPNTTVVGSLFENFETTSITSEAPKNISTPISNIQDYQPEPVQVNNDRLDTVDVDKSLSQESILIFVWLVLALILFVRKVTVYQGFIQYMKAGNTEVSDIKILNVLSDCEERLKIKTRVEVSYNPLIATPMLIGFLHPRIILPACKMSDKDLSYIFMHELIHYKQKDMFYKWLIQLVTCIHWFNPFVYLMEKEVNKSCELSCDEKLLSILDDQSRREYGDTLISFLKSKNHYKNSLASLTLTEGAEQLKERLGSIMNYKTKTKLIRMMTCLLTLIIFLGAVFIGGYPISAADSGIAGIVPKGIVKLPTQEDKKNGSGTYIYDEELNFGSYLDDEDDNEPEDVESNTYTYTQKGFYYDSYIIEMGWNLKARDQQYYDTKDIVLKDQSKMTVCFADTAKAYVNDNKAIKAIEGLINTLKNTEMSLPIEMPFVLYVTPIDVNDISSLVEIYYQNYDLNKFSALFPVLDETTQKDYLRKIYDNDEIAFFATIIHYLDDYTISQYIEKSDKDDKISFYSVLLKYIQPSDLQRYAEKYYNNNDIARFSILVNSMTKEEKQAWLIKAQAEKKHAFISVISNRLYD